MPRFFFGSMACWSRLRVVFVAVMALVSATTAQALDEAVSKAAAPGPVFLDSQQISAKLDHLIETRPFERLPVTRYDPMIVEEARALGVDPLLVKAVIHVESRFDRLAVSKRGAAGLMQLMPKTGRHFGADNRFDPRQNVRAGVTYLKQLLTRFRGDHRLALAAYNAGETAVARYRGVPPFKETQRYVREVLGVYQRASQ